MDDSNFAASKKLVRKQSHLLSNYERPEFPTGSKKNNSCISQGDYEIDHDDGDGVTERLKTTQINFQTPGTTKVIA
jgi:hypothetical protein